VKEGGEKGRKNARYSFFATSLPSRPPARPLPLPSGITFPTYGGAEGTAMSEEKSSGLQIASRRQKKEIESSTPLHERTRYLQHMSHEREGKAYTTTNDENPAHNSLHSCLPFPFPGSITSYSSTAPPSSANGSANGSSSSGSVNNPFPVPVRVSLRGRIERTLGRECQSHRQQHRRGWNGKRRRSGRRCRSRSRSSRRGNRGGRCLRRNGVGWEEEGRNCGCRERMLVKARKGNEVEGEKRSEGGWKKR
jgi:hypothetical protein